MNFKKQYEIAKHLADKDADYQEVELIFEYTSNAKDKRFKTKVLYRTEVTVVLPLAEEGMSVADVLEMVDMFAFERAQELNLIPFTWYFNEEAYQ